MAKLHKVALLVCSLYICSIAVSQMVSAANTKSIPAEVKINRFDDVKEKYINAILLCVKSSYAFVNGKRGKLDTSDDKVMPIVKDGIILVPAKFISESIGAELTWAPEENAVKIKTQSIEAMFVLGNSKCVANNSEVMLDAPAQLNLGKAYLPLSAVSKIFSKKVYTHDRLICISDKDMTGFFDDEQYLSKLQDSFGIYLSAVSGSDTVNSFERVKMGLKKMKQTDGLPEGGITVYIAGGDYRFLNTLSMDEDDSGSEEAPITYMALPGENVSFTGATNIPVDKFVPITNEAIKSRLYSNVRNKVLQINLEDLGVKDFVKDLPDTIGLYFNNEPQTIARWPNADFARMGKVLSQANQDNGGVIKYVDKAPDRWKNAKDIYLHGYWQYDWDDRCFALKSLNTDDKTFTLNEASPFGLGDGLKYYAYNLLEELDLQGEWYLNRQTAILYYYPPQDFRNGSLQLSVLDKTMIEMKNCSNISFSGITFEHSCGLAISMNEAKNNSIKSCTFRNLTYKAVEMRDVSGCGLSGCDLYNIGEGAVIIEGGDRATLTDGKNYVKNCYFTRYNIRLYCSFYKALELWGVGNIVLNNVFHDSGGCAVWFNGNKHLIVNNEFYDLDKISSDAGAVYAGADWTAQGNVIKNNIFHDIIGGGGRGGARPVYLDDFNSGTTVESNLFFNCDKPVFIHGGRENTIDSNIIANCGNSVWIQKHISGNNATNPYMSNMVSYNKAPVKSDLWKTTYPRLFKLLTDEPELPKYNTVTRTLNYNTPDFVAPEEAKASGTFENNISLKEDPGFEDAKNNIFKLKDGLNLIPDFKPINYDDVGLKLDNDRAALPIMSDFSLLSPEDGSIADSLILTWQPCTGAAKYHVQVSKDKNFNNIVIDKEISNNSFEASELEYGNTKYYWKVTAERTSVQMPAKLGNVGGVQSFATPLKGIVDTTELLGIIQTATKNFESVKTGEEIGECPKEIKDKFSKEIDNAKLVLSNDDLRQATINSAAIQLKTAMQKFQSSIISGNVDLGTILIEKENWVAVDPKAVKADGQKVIFKPKKIDGAVGYNNIVPNYPVWKFKAKFNLNQGWQGMSLRSNVKSTPVFWGGGQGYLIVIKQG